MPHTYHLSDSQLGLMLALILPVLGGLFWLYNAYRMGKLSKPTAPADPRLVTLAVFFIIVLAVVLLIAAK